MNLGNGQNPLRSSGLASNDALADGPCGLVDDQVAANQHFSPTGWKVTCTEMLSGRKMCIRDRARYASIAQTNGIVPIVEPEVLYDGNHTIEECSQVMSQVYRVLFDLLVAYKVDMKAVILKTSMSMAGKARCV